MLVWWDVDVYWLMKGFFDGGCLKFGVYVDFVLILTRIETPPEALFPYFFK